MNHEVYFWHENKHRSFLQVGSINLSVCYQACPKYSKEEVCISLHYLQKSRGYDMKLIFCSQVSTKVFYKLIVSLWVCVAMHAQSTQNNKFTISLQYLKENMKEEVDFLPADKRQRFFQIGTVILGVYGPACPNYLK